MSNPASFYDINALLLGYQALAPQAFTSGTAVTTGQVVDRSANQYPKSAALVVPLSYTASGAAAGDIITVQAVVKYSAVVGMTSSTTLFTESVVVPWVSNATLRQALCVFSVNLNAAQEFVQLSSLKLTVTTVGTYSSLIAGAAFVFGGFDPLPSTAYTAGYISAGNCAYLAPGNT